MNMDTLATCPLCGAVQDKAHTDEFGRCWCIFMRSVDALVERIQSARNREELDAIYVNGMAQFGIASQIDAIADVQEVGFGTSGEQQTLTPDIFKFE